MHLESDLRKALLQEELELYYQPKVNTLVGMLVGAEALIRWHHPVRGLVPPDRFIGIAEDTGMIVSIGAWVLQTGGTYVRAMPASAADAVDSQKALLAYYTATDRT